MGADAFILHLPELDLSIEKCFRSLFFRKRCILGALFVKEVNFIRTRKYLWRDWLKRWSKSRDMAILENSLRKKLRNLGSKLILPTACLYEPTNLLSLSTTQQSACSSDCSAAIRANPKSLGRRNPRNTQKKCARKRELLRRNLTKKTLRTTAILSYQTRPSSLKRGKETCNVQLNLHRVGCSARPTCRWAPKAHCMMGKTQ